jgi:hypothetical protein
MTGFFHHLPKRLGFQPRPTPKPRITLEAAITMTFRGGQFGVCIERSWIARGKSYTHAFLNASLIALSKCFSTRFSFPFCFMTFKILQR